MVPGTDSGQPGRQHGIARHVDRLLADLHDAPEHHVVDDAGIEIVALLQRPEGVRSEIDRMPILELAVASAERGSDRIDDHGGPHGPESGCRTAQT